MTERQIHEGLIAWLRKNRLSYSHHRMDKKSGIAVGFPDFCIVHCGRALLLELKTPKGRLSDAQKKMIAEIQRNGTPTHVCRSVEECVRVVETWMGLCVGKQNLSGRQEIGLPSDNQPALARHCVGTANRGLIVPAAQKPLKEPATDTSGGETAKKSACVAGVSATLPGSQQPVPSSLFIANVAGTECVCRGSGTPGSEFEIVRRATGADLMELRN